MRVPVFEDYLDEGFRGRETACHGAAENLLVRQAEALVAHQRACASAKCAQLTVRNAGVHTKKHMHEQVHTHTVQYGHAPRSPTPCDLMQQHFWSALHTGLPMLAMPQPSHKKYMIQLTIQDKE